MAQAAEASQHAGMVEDVEGKYLRGVAERVTATGGIEVHHETIQSENVYPDIVDFIGDDGTAVMSTHGRSGLGRLFAGSVAAGVVAHSRRAVVVMRPVGEDD